MEGQFRLLSAYRIVADPALVSVELSDENVLEKLVFTYQLPTGSELPSVIKPGDRDAKLDVRIPSYEFQDHAVAHAKNVSDNLCIFGIHEVDTENFEIEWIPENDVDKANLRLTSIGRGYGVPSAAFAQWRRSMLQRAITSQPEDQLFRVQLSFFRSGLVEQKKFAFATSFMYFFFFIESLFGDDAVKSRSLTEAFVSSEELMSALRISANKQGIDSAYGKLDPHESVKRIIDRRGFLLHNQSSKRRDWGRSLHDEFRDDAALLFGVSMDISQARLWPHGVPPGSAYHDAEYNAIARHVDREG